MIEEATIDAIKQAKIDYMAARDAGDGDAMESVLARSRALKEQLHILRNPPPPLPPLDDYKASRNRKIDSKTGELIDQGFEYDNVVFSLSQNAQRNWLAIYTASMDPNMPYPVVISTAVNEEYTLASPASISAFYWTGFAVLKGHYDSGRTLKIQANNATDHAGVDAVSDDR